MIARREVPAPDALDMRVYVNRQLACRNTTANMVRTVAQMLHEVTAFMTLCAGDVLLMGSPENAPLARIGDRVRIEIDGVGSIENPVMAEEQSIAGARP